MDRDERNFKYECFVRVAEIFKEAYSYGGMRRIGEIRDSFRDGTYERFFAEKIYNEISKLNGRVSTKIFSIDNFLVERIKESIFNEEKVLSE